MQTVLFLLGPTASGKTALACQLLDRFPGQLDLISVDSALVYREMDIGTAKPDAATLARYPHQLIDLIAPTAAYSAADFRRDALAAIATSHAAGRVPLLVGGTMMYVKALTEGLSALPPADADIRADIESRAAMLGWPALHAELALIDPATAARLAPNDMQRIQRALEVYAISGLPLSQLQQRKSGTIPSGEVFPFAARVFGLMPQTMADRTVLHERIAARFQSMLTAGLVDEVIGLRQRHALRADMPAMRCVGYRQVWQMLEGDLTPAAMAETGTAATRQLAKRQMTWLRAMLQTSQTTQTTQTRLLDFLANDLNAQLAQAIAPLLPDAKR